MKNDIQRKREEMAQTFTASLRHTIQIEYPSFMDELAEHAGCKPDVGKLITVLCHLVIKISSETVQLSENIYFHPIPKNTSTNKCCSFFVDAVVN